MSNNALVAQRIEQGSSKPEVAGSIPAERAMSHRAALEELLHACTYYEAGKIGWLRPALDMTGAAQRRAVENAMVSLSNGELQ